MGKSSKRMALCGMMTALAIVIMLMGGMIPLATFCCPVLASLALIPLLLEYGRKWALMAYAAVAALGLMLSPDKEAALLFAFLGYYPALKPALDRIRRQPLRIIAKLGIFNVAVGLAYLLLIFLFQMEQLLREYAEMGLALTAACLLLGNITLLLYDRLLGIFTALYVNKLRGKIL